MQIKIEDRERLQIIIAEYSSLRLEKINRINIGYQMAAVFIGSIGLFVAEKIDTMSISATILVTVLLGLAIWKVLAGVLNLATRIKNIEETLNQLSGMKLMEWESEWGGASHGLLKVLLPVSKRQ